jgi:hypothetical protein
MNFRGRLIVGVLLSGCLVSSCSQPQAESSSATYQSPPKTLVGEWKGMYTTIDISPDQRFSGTSNYLVKVSLGDSVQGFYNGILNDGFMTLGIDGRNGNLTYSPQRDVISYDGQEFRREVPKIKSLP